MNSIEELLKKIEELEAKFNTEVASLNKQINELKTENDFLRELNNLRLKEKYARKNEELKNQGYVALFDDIELNKEIDEVERKLEEVTTDITIKEHIRKKRVNLVNSDHSFEVVQEHIKLDDENLKDINSDIIVNKLCHQVERYYVKEIHIHQYQKKIGNNKLDTTIVRPEYKQSIFGKSMVDESLINSIIHKRVSLSLPLYRQEQELKRMGINLSRQDMSNYIYKAHNAYKPVIDKIEEYVLSREILRSDETTQLVIEINGKQKAAATKKSYIWGVSTCRSDNQAIYYRLGPGRDKNVAKDLFENRNVKYLMSDCLGSYMGLEGINNCYCLVHINRRFKELISSKTPKEAPSVKLVSKISHIFHIDKAICSKYKDDYENIKIDRNLFIKPYLDELYAEIEDYKNKALPKGKLGIALTYAYKAKQGVYNVLQDGRLDFDNNFSEREAMKPWVIGRKASLFSNTKQGATVTCGLYTLIRTAILNNLNPYEYLQYLALNLPINEDSKFDYSNFLPWSSTLPDYLKVKKPE